ncbi:uncharacterized protein LOC124709028 [Schistocerca piceifrons]|uniref:uncharacterized protein LOC124709028 n=1 Tax=Schistocerca piceifrons TaxID=274613 RepID=UPI001F5FB7E4|nr:uncharacterized protein LOC124709028 [Schistocerca piceifrons]
MIGSYEVEVMLDTGAAASVISMSLYNELKQIMNIQTLQVQNCHIISATGNKSKNVKFQVLINFTFSNIPLNYSFLVVDKLVMHCILGIDFLNEYQAIIDLGKGKCHLTVNQQQLTIELTQGKSRKQCEPSNS